MTASDSSAPQAPEDVDVETLQDLDIRVEAGKEVRGGLCNGSTHHC